jgi:hypothetical protein
MAEMKTDPVVLQRGLPPEQRNGMYGDETRLISLGVGARFTAVVTLEVADIRSSEKEQTHWPVIALAHIEPIWDAAGIEATRAAQETSYKERTGANQLNFDGIVNEPDDGKTAAEREAEFEDADPKGKK